MLREPSDSPLQRFNFTDNGYVALVGNPDLGFAVVEGAGSKAGGPSHLRRDLSLNTLSETDPSLATWKIVKSTKSWPERIDYVVLKTTYRIIDQSLVLCDQGYGVFRRM